jgi:hypothetical protein
MSERMSEAELREIEEPGLDGGPVRHAFAERLVGEVRRLRGLIVAWDDPHCVEAADLAVAALRAEARTIGEERGLT